MPEVSEVMKLWNSVVRFWEWMTQPPEACDGCKASGKEFNSNCSACENEQRRRISEGLHHLTYH